MADYTHMNLKDVEDLAPKFGMAPGLEARFPTAELGLEKSGLSYQRFDPGYRLPFGHKHKAQEEVYVIAGGGGRAKLGDDVVELRQWDVIRIPSETMRSIEAGPHGLELLAFGAPNVGPVDEDVDMVPGWWSG